MKSYFCISTIICLVVNSAYVRAEPHLKLGFLGPLTGNAAILGVDALPAIQIAIEEEKAKGIDIQLFVEDDQYLTAKSIAGYKKLTGADQIDAMVLLTYGGLFALKDSISKDKILTVDTLDCDESIAKIEARNIICLSKGTEDLGEVIAKAIVKRNIPKVSFIYFDGDPFMGILATATKAYLENHGSTKIVAYDGYSNGSDFKAIILKAKKAGSKGYIFYGYDDFGNALFQARSLGIKDPFFGVNTFSSPGFQSTAKGAEEGSLISTYLAPRNKGYDDFIEAFKKKMGREPNFEVSTFPSYDAIKILADGIRAYEASQKTNTLREFLVDYMYSINKYDGLSGAITIDADGATRSIKNSLFEIRGGKLVAMKD